MSILVLSWVFQNSEATLGDRLTLLALADYCHDDGTNAYASVESYARKSRLSKRNVQRSLRKLEADGRIEQTGVRPNGCVVYRVRLLDAPEATQGDDSLSWGGMTTTTRKDDSLSSDSSESSKKLTPQTPHRPATVARRRVTTAEAEMAEAILDEWNRQTNQVLRADIWFTKLVGRVREHPDLTIEDHQHIITANLANPWWDGPPSPSVVYGNDGQFERSMLTARNGNGNGKKRFGRGVASGDLVKLAAKLDAEGR